MQCRLNLGTGSKGKLAQRAGGVKGKIGVGGGEGSENGMLTVAGGGNGGKNYNLTLAGAKNFEPEVDTFLEIAAGRKLGEPPPPPPPALGPPTPL